MKEYSLGELLSYEQPTKYIVQSTDYRDEYTVPVLTPGKTFILGYTNEREGVYNALPIILFDDFTTASRYVDFPFKVKSSAVKILTANTDLVLPKYIYNLMQFIEIDHSTHKRYWISNYSKIRVLIPSLDEQLKVVEKFEEYDSKIDNSIETLKQVLLQMNALKKSIYKQTFEGKVLCSPFQT